jgi:hypothetical protein
MNESTKQNIRGKVKSYLKRAEEIQNIMSKTPSKKTPVASGAMGPGNSNNNKGSDGENEDPEKKRMMQKFEGLLYYIHCADMTIIVSINL